MSVPGKAEFYLMQVAQEIRRVLAKNPAAVLMDHFRIKFVRGGEKGEDTAPKMTKEQATALSKAVWAARLGLKQVPAEVSLPKDHKLAQTGAPLPPRKSPRKRDSKGR